MDMMSLIDTFFKTDDLKALIHQAGQMLNCPMIAIDDAFQIQAGYSPENFQDDVFFAALHRGEITYEAILAISQNEQISQGKSVRMQLQDTPYPRCFAALISSEIRIGYLIYVDWKDTLSQVPESDLQMLQMILAKQLLSESSRNRILSSTSEEILVRLLQGEFPSESVFQLQTASSYLAQYHPHRLAVVDLGLYRNLHFGQDTLKTELRYLFYASHPFFYQKQLLFFLTGDHDTTLLHSFSQKFQLRIVISGALDCLYHLPQAYQTAQKALEYMLTQSNQPFVVWSPRLYPRILLSQIQAQDSLCHPAVSALDEYDRSNHTQYCLTLYTYLICHHSLQETCERLFLHRNTALYRIRKMKDQFEIPLDDPEQFLYLLLSVSMILLREGKEELFFSDPTQPL